MQTIGGYTNRATYLISCMKPEQRAINNIQEISPFRQNLEGETASLWLLTKLSCEISTEQDMFLQKAEQCSEAWTHKSTGKVAI